MNGFRRGNRVVIYVPIAQRRALHPAVPREGKGHVLKNPATVGQARGWVEVKVDGAGPHIYRPDELRRIN